MPPERLASTERQEPPERLGSPGRLDPPHEADFDPSVPRCRPDDPAAPVFGAPWQAQVFAITVALHERGLFQWSEWARYLGDAIQAARAAGDPDLGDTYYEHWLAALEALLRDKAIASPLVLTALRQAWRVAAERTPHGQPIELASAIRRRLVPRPEA